jgi:hypothetical protein
MAIAALATGCGGSDDNSESASQAADSGSTANAESGSSTGSSTEAEAAESEDEQSEGGSSSDSTAFVREANAICEGAAVAVLTFEPSQRVKEGKGKTFDEAAIPGALVPGFEAVVAEVGDLEAPSEDEEQVEAFLEALEEDVEEVKDEEPATFEAAEALLEDSSALAREAGLTKCAFA